jgi:type 1 glutamine amidotransferase
MRIVSSYRVTAVTAAFLASAACGPTGPSADELNRTMNSGSASSAAGNGSTSAGTGSTNGGSSGSSNATGGSGNDNGSAGTVAQTMGGSSAGSDALGGTAGSDALGGSAPSGGSGGGGGGEAPSGPYAPRSGSFKMLVYSATKGFRHDSAIVAGKPLLQQIGLEQGFEVVLTETNELITPEGLAQFEIVFFLNSTGDIFNDVEQKAYEDWMTLHDGAFAGTHSATDTENGWPFYAEVTGQYYNGHGNANAPDQIQFEAAMLSFPALKGLPNPWQRNEEWYKFDSFQVWSVKPGFKILGRKAADGQPIIWAREWGNFRSFYTAIGHDGVVFQDPDVKKHLTGGIMWAVRREHLIK